MTQKNHKESFYFPHYYGARNDDKILELRARFGAEWYGVFWMILETMAENSDGTINRGLIGGLSLGYNIPISQLKDILDFLVQIDLFVEEQGLIFSPKMNEHKEYKKSLQDAGKAGADKRWKNREANSPPNGKEKKRKEKKDISKDIYVHFETFWNICPKKIKKTDTEKKFLSLSIDESLAAIAGMELYKKYWEINKTEIRYIPAPVVWINQKRWLDEVDLTPPKQNNTPANALTPGKKDYSLPSKQWR